MDAHATTFNDVDRLLTRREAAEYLRLSYATLERWSRLGQGPRPVMLGKRRAMYRLSDLRAFLERGGVAA